MDGHRKRIMSKFSIITVCFNSDKTIRDTIESVLSQQYSDIEYIIINGASTDKTQAIINEYADCIDVVVNELDRGIYDAMNKGLSLATGDWIGFLNADDFYSDKSVLCTIAEQFQASPDSDLVYGDVIFVDQKNQSQVIRHYRSANFKAWKLRFGRMPPHPGTFITRRAYESVGKYSLEYQISADYEMFVRLLLVHRFKLTRLDRVLVKMRAGGLSTSGIRSSFILNQEIIKACRNNGVYTNWLLVLSKLPLKLMELLPRFSKSKVRHNSPGDD